MKKRLISLLLTLLMLLPLLVGAGLTAAAAGADGMEFELRDDFTLNGSVKFFVNGLMIIGALGVTVAAGWRLLHSADDDDDKGKRTAVKAIVYGWAIAGLVLAVVNLALK